MLAVNKPNIVLRLKREDYHLQGRNANGFLKAEMYTQSKAKHQVYTVGPVKFIMKLLFQPQFASPMKSNRVVQKYTKYMISKNNKLLHVKLSIKIHVMGFLTLSDPLG